MNQIDVVIRFSYQGETYSPRARLDLDRLMRDHGGLPNPYLTLAQASGIDTYSYLYEVMESYPLEFSNATGIAGQCLSEGHFDAAAFEQLWHEQQQQRALAEIARKHLGIDDLEQQPGLGQALWAAYRLGQGKTN